MKVNLKILYDRYFAHPATSATVADMRFQEHSVLDLPKYIVMPIIKNGGTKDEPYEVPDDFWTEVENKRADRILYDEEEASITAARLSALQAEKEKDTERALQAYRKSISLGENAKHDLFGTFAHSYKRIVVLLHKTKNYGKEAEYLRSFLAHYEKYPNAPERLWAEKRLLTLMEKYLQ